MELKERFLPRVLAEIGALMENKDQVLVAIDGQSGSGKTTLANLIAQALECNLFQMDDFFLSPALKTPARLKEVGGNVYYERFQKEIMAGLKSRHNFFYRAYNCQKNLLEEKILIRPQRLNIIEGSYSMHPELIRFYDLKIFMQIDPLLQSERILKRNGPAMYKKFMEEWIPLENYYFTQGKIKEKADMVYIV